MQRLRIVVEFNKNRKDDLELYAELLKYSNPGAYIKDVLKGLLPIPGAYTKDILKESLPIPGMIESKEAD